MGAIWLLPLTIVSLLLGLPLFVIMGVITAYCYLFIAQEPATVIIGDIFFAADKEVLLAIPLFVLAGQIMTKGSISARLINFAKALTAGIPGGMGVATIFACTVFAAICGSSPVTLIAIGGIMYPALLKHGYSKDYAIGTTTVGGTLGIIVPPSIPMIIFAIMASVSVVDLFKAGIGPSLVLVTFFVGYALFKAPAGSKGKYSGAEILFAFKRGILALLMPLIILGGIYTGFFTATESAAVAVLYAILVELFVHREFKLSMMGQVLVETAEMLGMLFLILILAVSLNKFMTIQEIPQDMVAWISTIIDSKVSFLVIVNILLLVVGCFMDIMSAILVLAPLLTPMAVHYGIDPVHFGIIMIVNLEIGYLTPPIGMNLFVASGLYKVSIGDVTKSVLPYLILMLLALALISAIPGISLFFV